MNEKQNSTKPVNYILLPEVEALIRRAQTVAKDNNKIFVAASFTTLVEKCNVAVHIPAASAKYIKFVPAHEICVLDDKKTGLKILKLPEHYIHGDFTSRDETGKVKPTVIRHMMVNEPDLGKEIPCTVLIKEKFDLLTGEKTIIIDILAQTGKFFCDKVLRLGVSPIGVSGEVNIPNSEACIRLEKSETGKTLERISGQTSVPPKDKPCQEKEKKAEVGKPVLVLKPKPQERPKPQEKPKMVIRKKLTLAKRN